MQVSRAEHFRRAHASWAACFLKNSQHRLVLREPSGLQACCAQILSNLHEMPQDVKRDSQTSKVAVSQTGTCGLALDAA